MIKISIPEFSPKILWIVILILLLTVLIKISFPDNLFNDPVCTVLFDRNGNLLGGKIADDEQWRFPYNRNVPYKFTKCITRFEDRFFYYHSGVNLVSVGRALMLNLKAGKIKSGGSTLTMQCIRIARKGKPRTIFEKLIETAMAVRMEMTYSKDEILALYSSNAPFGGNVVGLDAAAWRYFGKNSDNLSWAESATLAILPNSPALIYPGKNQQKLLAKRNRLLKDLYENEVIDKQEYLLACNEPLPGKPYPLPQIAPHLLNRVIAEGHKGKKVDVTIDLHFQEFISEIIQRYHERYKLNKIFNVAVLVLDVETGSSVAYVGNADNPDYPEAGSYVDIITSRRSTGSILKPFLYASMLNDGLILPKSLVADIPVQLGSFMPENYNYTYDGAVQAQRALSRSLNIPAVKMLQKYGQERFHYMLKRIGLTTLDKPASHYGLSIIIGGAEANLWDLAGAYASMARTLNHYQLFNSKYNRKDFHPANYLLEEEKYLKNSSGNDDHSVLDAAAIWFTFQAMVEVSRPDEEASWKDFPSSAKVAWKTGTSYGSRDAWSIGVTPQYVVAVWVGNADGEGRPGLTGLNHAAPVLFEVLKVLRPKGWFYTPYDDMVQIPVCHHSGFRTSVNCEKSDTCWAPTRGFRSPLCPYHQIVHLDISGKYRVTSDCESIDNMIHKSWFVLPPVMEYYFKSRNPFYKTLPPFRDGCLSVDNSLRNMDMIYPQENSQIYIPVDIDGQLGKVVFRAAHRIQDAKIFWYIDEDFIGITTDFHQMGLSPPPGKHTLTLTDNRGETITRNFEIIDKNK